MKPRHFGSSELAPSEREALESRLQSVLDAFKNTQPPPHDRPPLVTNLPVVGAGGHLPPVARFVVHEKFPEVLKAPAILTLWSPIRDVYEEQPSAGVAFISGLGSALVGFGGPLVLWMSAFAPAKLEKLASLLPFVG